ncbi:hypothetical protein D3C84_544370 [compost metagenome]
MAVAGEVLQAQVIVEVVLEVGCKGALLDLFFIKVFPAEIIFAIDTTHFLAVEGRYPIVRQVVVHLMERTQRQARGFTQTQAQGRGDPPALTVNFFATGDIVLVAHEVDPQGAVITHALQRLVAVQGHAVVIVGTDTATQAGEGAILRLLADDVDAAAGCAGTAEHRVRPFDHFDLLDIEGVGAIGLGAVAQTVNLDVAVGREATDVDAVARATAAFASVEGDARDVGQHLAKAQGLLLLNHLGRHYSDGLGRIKQ